MKEYNHSKIEAKWQKLWQREKTFAAADNSRKQKYYALDMFPYPSGEGLHVGHPEGYIATDIVSHYKRMNGYEVLHPIGWDAFGLPAENYAIKKGVHPKISIAKNIKHFKSQLQKFGFSFDWGREINTAEPDYYRWTQWLFLRLYKRKLAYQKKAPVNWCESCKTVLANEQVINGECERCGGKVSQKELKQWFFKITDYAEGLLSQLDKLDWPEKIKSVQRNWIGKSEGARINFPLAGQKTNIEIFTTRPETIFGATYLVVSPEHPLLNKLKNEISNWKEISQYQKTAQKKNALQRTDLAKEKTGVEIKGIKAINPANKKEIPIWVADYILMGYGTGAVMSVPAHDPRDWLFAKKYNLPIKQVIKIEGNITRSYLMGAENITVKDLNKIGIKIVEITDEKDYKIEIPKTSIKAYEELLKNKLTPGFWNEYINSEITFLFKHKDGKIRKIILNNSTEEEIDKLAAEFMDEKWKKSCVWKWLAENSFYTEYIIHSAEGIIINSEKFDGLDSKKAKDEIIKYVKGKKETQYKLRDWLISRQRYWGSPIPIIHCDECGEVPVPEKDLPVKLPEDVDFKPTGESPLVNSQKFHQVKCPRCGKKAKRESDTMDTFVCSAWYYLRYADPANKNEPFAKEKIKHWLPVDLYIGGAEHAVMHLLYVRFIAKVLHDAKLIEFSEPMLKLRNQGLILGTDHQKMSKSRGNVINPDEVITEYGADVMRLFEMFMGPLEDSKPWSTKGILGLKRFLDRVWQAGNVIVKNRGTGGKKTSAALANTINKVTADIENLKFNTAISALMVCLRALEAEQKNVSIGEWRQFLLLLYPFTPHIISELWQISGAKNYVWENSWPKSEQKIEGQEASIAIQINGKTRGIVSLPAKISEAEAVEKAKNEPKIATHLINKNIQRAIYVPGRIINFVVK